MSANSTNGRSGVKRYVGASAFSARDQVLFSGREAEVEQLFLKVLATPLLLLFGRSGIGKTSILRAGLYPRLREKRLLPVPVRFNEKEVSACEAVYSAVRAACSTGVDLTEGDRKGIWEFLQTTLIWEGDSLLTPVLILDQFEEVFTRDQTFRTELTAELGALASGVAPERIQSPAERHGTAPDVKLIVSIREDYFGALQEFNTSIPGLFQERFRLLELSKDQATEAICEPATRDSGEGGLEFLTPPFKYDSDALKELLKFLMGESQIVEPFQLQLLCSHLEDQLVRPDRPAADRALVTPEDLGGEKGMRAIQADNYRRAINNLPPEDRRRARRLCEEGLLDAQGHRQPLDEGKILREFGVTPEILGRMVGDRLLDRHERPGKRFYYEVSHDRLAETIYHSRPWIRAIPRRTRQAVMGAMLVGVAAAGLLLFALFRLTVFAYYDGYRQGRDAIKPIGELRRGAERHRRTSIRVTRRGFLGPITSIEAVDSSDKVNPHDYAGTFNAGSKYVSLPSRIEFVYDQEKRIVDEIALDEQRHMIGGIVYAPSKAAPDKSVAYFVGPDGLPLPLGKSRAEVIAFQYNPEGFEIKRRYLDREGNPAPGNRDAFGKATEYRPEQSEITETFLDRNGNPMNDSAGNASWVMTFDRLGNLIAAIARDVSGRPTRLNKEGFSKFRCRFDGWGNPTETRFLDVDGTPVIHQAQGYHMARVDYDDAGNPIEYRYYDAQLNPMKKQAQGQIDTPYFHEDTTPAFRADNDFGYYQKVLHYANNLLKQVSYFDTNNAPVVGPEGAHEVRYSYDQNGNRAGWSYYDSNRQAVNGPDGWHEVKYRNDPDGKTSEETYYDQDARNANGSNGAHMVRLKRDASGRELEAAFFGSDSKPTVTKDGRYYRRESVYNERGWLLKETYYGTHGEPCQNKSNGSHQRTLIYYSSGNVQSIQYFDLDAKRANSGFGYHSEKLEYNEFGKPTQIAYYDTDTHPAANEHGIHKMIYTYDERGLLVEETIYAPDGRLVEDDNGVARVRYDYNSKRQRTLTEYFGAQDRVIRLEGAHRIVTKYDDFGRLICVTKE